MHLSEVHFRFFKVAGNLEIEGEKSKERKARLRKPLSWRSEGRSYCKVQQMWATIHDLYKSQYPILWGKCVRLRQVQCWADINRSLCLQRVNLSIFTWKVSWQCLNSMIYRQVLDCLVVKALFNRKCYEVCQVRYPSGVKSVVMLTRETGRWIIPRSAVTPVILQKVKALFNSLRQLIRNASVEILITQQSKCKAKSRFPSRTTFCRALLTFLYASNGFAWLLIAGELERGYSAQLLKGLKRELSTRDALDLCVSSRAHI